MTAPGSSRRAMVLTAVGCAVGGWLAFVVPYELAFSSGETRARNVMDGFQFVTLLLLPLGGFAAGAVTPRGWLLWGPCAVAFLPCRAAVEVLIDPTSHNLWPLELAFYAAFALWTSAGSGIGAYVRSRSAGRPVEP